MLENRVRQYGGADVFTGQINASNVAYLLALNEIPLTVEICREHYNCFIAKYLKAYKKKLTEDIGIAQSLNYERYWEEVIKQLR